MPVAREPVVSGWQISCCPTSRRIVACYPAIAARAAPDTEVPFASISMLAGSSTRSGVVSMESSSRRTTHIVEIVAILAAAGLQVAATVLWLQDLV